MCGLLERPVRLGENEIAGEVLLGPLLVGVLSRANGHEDVPLGHDADAVELRVLDNRGSDATPRHQRACLAKRVMGPDDQHIGAHGVAYVHGELLLGSSGCGGLASSSWPRGQDRTSVANDGTLSR